MSRAASRPLKSSRQKKPAAVVRPWIYDRTLVGLASGWYREVLERLPRGSYLLDVGIGTGGSLARNADLVEEKELRILGLDIDRDYLTRCREALVKAGLDGRVETRLESVYDHQGGPYDAVYFSSSFPVLPDPGKAVEHTAGLLAPAGRVYFTQTFNTRRSPLLERIKPMLHRLTTIHFGQVTYEADFRRTLRQAGLEVEELTTLGKTGKLSYRLAIGRPQAALADAARAGDPP